MDFLLLVLLVPAAAAVAAAVWLWRLGNAQVIHLSVETSPRSGVIVSPELERTGLGARIRKIAPSAILIGTALGTGLREIAPAAIVTGIAFGYLAFIIWLFATGHTIAGIVGLTIAGIVGLMVAVPRPTFGWRLAWRLPKEERVKDQEQKRSLESYYIANQNTREIHEVGCSLVAIMKDENKVPYSDLEAVANLIRSRGYNGCQYCLPRYDTVAHSRQQVLANLEEALLHSGTLGFGAIRHTVEEDIPPIAYPGRASLRRRVYEAEDIDAPMGEPKEESPESGRSGAYVDESYYAGDASLPRKVYVDDAHDISVDLSHIEIPSIYPETLHVEDSESGKSITVRLERDDSLEQFLEIELLAAGLKVAGKKKQQQRLTLPTLSYRWNCAFLISGDHEISLVVRLVNPSGTVELGAIRHTIKVAKLDHLTQRQVWMLARLFAIVPTGALAYLASLVLGLS